MFTTSKIAVPTIPSVAIRLLELYDDPDFQLQDVVNTLQSDPALSAKILKAANSPAYGTGREVSEFKRAISLLGKSVVTPLVLSFSLAEKSMAARGTAELFRQYWLQAIVQAITAEYLAKQYARARAGEWFVAGLLSSIGRLALINHDSEKYQQVMDHAETHHVSLHEAEQKLLETTTVDLSVELLREWNLPRRWVDATAKQFRIVEALESLPEQGTPHERLIVAIATAEAVGTYFCQHCQGEALIRIVHLMEEGFDASEDDVQELIEAVRKRLEDVAHLFQVQGTTQGSPVELMTRAMQHLSRLAVEQAMEMQKRRDDPFDESVEDRRCLLNRIDRLMQRASTDSLTGLYNRGYFEDRFCEQIAATIGTSQSIGLILMDVDHFKSINDTHGHIAGDEVLKRLADALKGVTRSSDFVARYGGEEFVVIVADAQADYLSHLGERFRRLIEQLEIVHNGTTIPVTISVGAAMGCPVSGVDGFGERLIAFADAMLYEAKRSGRNRVIVADPTTDQPS